MVATPGRLQRLLEGGGLELSQCRMIVLDEVDVLLGACGRRESAALVLWQDNESKRWLEGVIIESHAGQDGRAHQLHVCFGLARDLVWNDADESGFEGRGKRVTETCTICWYGRCPDGVQRRV